MRSLYGARMVPLPGSAMPIASHRQFMELAVNMPEQEPQPGQALFSMASSSPVDFPRFERATAFEYADEVELPRRPAGQHRSAADMMVGRLTRTAAMSMPGMILSQLGMHTMPSKQWATDMVSTQSAITSRLASE